VDYDAIGDALAARFRGLSTPSGEDPLTNAAVTNELPDALSTTPALLVWPPVREDFQWGPSNQRWVRQEWHLHFYRASSGTLAQRLVGMQKWRPLLVDRIVGQIQLGLAYVDWAELNSIVLSEGSYAEIAYDDFDLTVIVQIRETVAAAA
jgi:hypothetical protein